MGKILYQRPEISFHFFNSQESFIKELINDIHRLVPENGIREAYIKHFMYTLQRRAHSLIKFIEGESLANHNASVRVNVKRMRHDLGLQLEGDFKMVLAAAEKLKPGLHQFLFGEKKYDNEYLPNMADVL